MLAIECAALAKPLDALCLMDRVHRIYDRFAAIASKPAPTRDRVTRDNSESAPYLAGPG